MFSDVNWPDALERAVRTFVQTAAGALLALLSIEGASWDDVPQAALAAAFAGLLAVVAYVASPPRT